MARIVGVEDLREYISVNPEKENLNAWDLAVDFANHALENPHTIGRDPNIMTKDEEIFEAFWNAYDKKVGKVKTFKKWKKLSVADKNAAYLFIPQYKQARPDKQFRRDPFTYLNQRTWEDEIIATKIDTQKTLNYGEQRDTPV